MRYFSFFGFFVLYFVDKCRIGIVGYFVIVMAKTVKQLCCLEDLLGSSLNVLTLVVLPGVYIPICWILVFYIE